MFNINVKNFLNKEMKDKIVWLKFRLDWINYCELCFLPEFIHREPCIKRIKMKMGRRMEVCSNH